MLFIQPCGGKGKRSALCFQVEMLSVRKLVINSFVKEPIGLMRYKTSEAGADYCENVCVDTYKKAEENTFDQLLKGFSKIISDWGLRLSKNPYRMPQI